jgi:Holliday junction resolvase YEN1
MGKWRAPPTCHRVSAHPACSIYKEIGPGQRIAVSKLAAEHYIQHSRPFCLAIDISIWLFQIQSGKGGTNPALRTFYYRLLRLLSLNIHPLFVFDGPNKPTWKRNKKVGGPNVRVSSVPEFLAKQLLKHFGFPLHYAPGEAEAECALLQREGIVDAVLSEDVDTLMFGSGMTLRSWTPEQKSSKTPTHVNVYRADATKETSGLDRNGMILVAMMSGGDYITEGIPGCGPKLACEAARAGFGDELCSLDRKDTEGLNAWRDRLRHEIRTNESKHFRQKRPGLTIPDTFPDQKVLSYYTHPCISTSDKVAKLKDTVKWDMPLDYSSLRDFAGDAFDWRCIGGAKKFIRNLAPAVLVRELRMRGEAVDGDGGSLSAQKAREASLINAIHGKRLHPTTDNIPELRISFKPIELIDIDLSIEDPDEEIPEDEDDSDSEPLPTEDGECPGSPKKKRGPSTYDPTVHEKVWLLDTFVRLGAPLKVQDWEAGAGAPKPKPAPRPRKAVTNEAAAARKPTTAKKTAGMQRGALDQFTKTTKPGVDRTAQSKSKSPECDELDLTKIDAIAKQTSRENSVKAVPKSDSFKARAPVAELDLSGGTSSRASSIQEVDLSLEAIIPQKRSSKRPSPEPLSPPRRARPRIVSPFRETSGPPEVVDLLSSSPGKPTSPKVAPVRSSGIHDHFKQFSKPVGASRDQIDLVAPLPDTVTRRRKRSPLKRYQTAPTTGADDTGSPLLRPSTPRGLDIEAIDLASPESLPKLPRFGAFQRVSDKMREAVALSAMPTPSTRPTVTRSELSDAARPAPVRDEIEILEFSSSMPTPPYEQEQIKAVPAPERPIISMSALLPVNKRLRDRKVEAAAVATKSSITVSNATSTSRAQDPETIQSIVVTEDQLTIKTPVQKIKKRFIQPRDSLPGNWKEVVMEVDLTAPTPKDRRMYRKSGVEELDLTGE